MSTEKFIEITKKGYSLDMVFILELVERGEDISFLKENGVKLSSFYQTLIRKALISEENKITLEGKELLAFIKSEDLLKIKKNKPSEDIFEKWWKVYPATDTFIHKNRRFTGTRALRVKKEDCKLKIEKILNEGEYTIQNLIDALQLEIEQKKENSIKTGQNKLSYMQNSLTYLNQKTYEPFIELSKQQIKSVITSETYI